MKRLGKAGVFFFVYLITFSIFGFSDTDVSGIISSDKTWTLTGSPYITSLQNRWMNHGPSPLRGDVISTDPKNQGILFASVCESSNSYYLMKSEDGGSTWNKSSVGGEINTIAIDPNNSNIIYIGFFWSGKIAKSVDSGLSWQELSVSFDRPRSIEIDYVNSNVIYVGTQDGIFKSTDGGLSWKASSFGIENLGHTYARDIAINPQNTSIIYLLTSSGIYKSADSALTWNKLNTDTNSSCIILDPRSPNTIYCSSSGGISKSNDGGLNWRGISFPSDDGVQINGGAHAKDDIAVDPMDSSIIYVATGHGIYESIDYGESWIKIYGGWTNSIAIDSYAPENLFCASESLGIVKSTDRGLNWKSAGPSSEMMNIESFAIDPRNFNDIYVSDGWTLFKSADTAKSWSELLPYYMQIKAIAMDPLDSKTIYLGGDGVLKSIDGGKKWSKLFLGYSSVDIMDMAIFSADSSTIYACGDAANESRIFVSGDKGITWGMSYSLGAPGGGSVIACGILSIVIDPTNKNKIYAIYTQNVGNLVYPKYIGGILSTKDSGAHWVKKEFNDSAKGIAINPIHPSIIYCGIGKKIFKSIDEGANWKEIKDMGYLISDISFDPANINRIYVATHGGGIIKSIDGGNNWTPANDGLNEKNIFSLEIAPTSPPTVYASTAKGLYSIQFSPESWINLSSDKLYYGATSNGAFTGAQTVLISNSGEGTLSWSASTQNSWIIIQPSSSAAGPESITIGVDPSKLAAGTYSGVISIIDLNALNSPQTISVTLNVYAADSSSPPFGYFDTPIDGTPGITGAIPVTGWALDDIETTKVEIWRDAFTGETPGLWKVGEAIFVEGARPDVEQAYPDRPFNYRAGWGYMMLTYGLPAQGNGEYRLHAFAEDKEGNRVLLGSKTIVCDNAHGKKPFGTIDTPAQGGEVSGSAYVNFGWVLTPQPNMIPIDGSTINLFVDGVNLGHPTYNNYRSDIALQFPGYLNTGAPGAGGPVGYFYLDTTTYPNGVHEIWWVATDDGGRIDGIGSRYFTIVNTGTGAPASAQSIKLEKADSYESVMNLPVSFEPGKIRKGFNVEADPEVLRPDNYGTIQIEIREVERIEVDLGKGRDYRGYLVVGGELRPLPIGSTLNQKNGTFFWMPGPGFIGKYDLLFLQTDKFGITRRIPVEMTIRPKFEK